MTTGLLSLQRPGIGRALVTVGCLVAVADLLFYEHPLGISLAVFLLALGIGSTVAAPRSGPPGQWVMAAVCLILATGPVVIQPGPLPIAFGIVGAAYLAVTLSTESAGHVDRLFAAVPLFAQTGWRIAPDPYRIFKDFRKAGWIALDAGTFLAWVVPVGLGGVFLGLFAAANPLIDNRLMELGPVFAHVAVRQARVFGWAATAALVWPFIVVQPKTWRPSMGAANTPTSCNWMSLFGAPTIRRSLILFNALFLIQTCMDVFYLWGEAALPDGLTYADYAHRGAYPLIVTALLAGWFAIVATKPGAQAAGSAFTRQLMLLWIGQNLLLVVSSLQRLHLYVQAYSLTTLRLWAFVWMVLVGVGLISITARIVLGRSDAWLLRINLCSLVLALYVSCFVDAPKTIATYNVHHCREISGQGAALDLQYLRELGPQAIPALDILHRLDEKAYQHSDAPLVRAALAAEFSARPSDWRRWDFWSWRLAGYLRRPSP